MIGCVLETLRNLAMGEGNTTVKNKIKEFGGVA
jgi:hypothetical protein